jgi:hypothetical protein
MILKYLFVNSVDISGTIKVSLEVFHASRGAGGIEEPRQQYCKAAWHVHTKIPEIFCTKTDKQSGMDMCMAMHNLITLRACGCGIWLDAADSLCSGITCGIMYGSH